MKAIYEGWFYWPVYWAWLIGAAAAFVALLFRTAPYGRFARPGWGPRLSGRVGWAMMESPALLFIVLLFAFGTDKSPTAWVFLALFAGHYAYRGAVFPLLIRGGPSVPATVAGMGAGFHVVNGYVQGAYLFALGPVRDIAWLTGVRFPLGAAMFVAGFAAHVWADARLRSLRRPGETDYHIPRGGLFEWVSCPNYLGEMIEWVGWAVLTWSPAGAAFALWTIANLLPRARATHRWYCRQFADYPPRRRSVIPFLL